MVFSLLRSLPDDELFYRHILPFWPFVGVTVSNDLDLEYSYYDTSTSLVNAKECISRDTSRCQIPALSAITLQSMKSVAALVHTAQQLPPHNTTSCVVVPTPGARDRLVSTSVTEEWLARNEVSHLLKVLPNKSHVVHDRWDDVQDICNIS